MKRAGVCTSASAFRSVARPSAISRTLPRAGTRPCCTPSRKKCHPAYYWGTDGRNRCRVARGRARRDKCARGASVGRSAARPRAAGRRCIPTRARSSTTAAAWRPAASRNPPSGPSARSWAWSPRSRQETDYVSSGTNPHLTVPEHVGVEQYDKERWACRRQVCRELAGGTPTQAFRESSVVDSPRKMTAHVASRGGRNTDLPCRRLTEGSDCISDWDAVAELFRPRGLRDRSYRKNFDEPGGFFVGRLRDLAHRDSGAARRPRTARAAELRARHATTFSISRARSPPPARPASRICGRGPTRRAAT